MSRPRHRLANQLGKVPSVDEHVPFPHDELSASDKPSPDNTSGVYVAAKNFRVRQGEGWYCGFRKFLSQHLKGIKRGTG